MFSVVLDKICVFCLYPIPDSQQCAKRGSCRCQICSGYCLYFHFGPQAHLWRVSNLGLEPYPFLFYRVLESFCISFYFVFILRIHLFCVNCRFMSNCYLCLNIVNWFSHLFLCLIVFYFKTLFHVVPYSFMLNVIFN